MLRAPASSLPPPFPDALRVAVIQGGPSSEAEVSRVSSAAVAAALAKCGHDVTRLECDRTLPARLLEVPFEVVFPVVHGAVGEDGALQGLLELLSLPYVGAGVLGSALANDKVQAKVAFRAAGLPVAEERVLVRGSAPIDVLSAQVVEAIGKSVVVKPATQGSSIGVTLLPSLSGAADRALHEAIAKAFVLDEKVLIERYVHGKEITCGVLDLGEPVEPLGASSETAFPLPPTEIVSKAAHWYDFRSRYGRGGSEHLCPAPLPEATARRVQQIALGAHLALGIRDLSRADFVVTDDGEIVLLEVNTMPGMTATSLFPEAAGVFGLPFEKLCDRLVHAAKARGACRRNPAVPFPT